MLPEPESRLRVTVDHHVMIIDSESSLKLLSVPGSQCRGPRIACVRARRRRGQGPGLPVPGVQLAGSNSELPSQRELLDPAHAACPLPGQPQADRG